MIKYKSFTLPSGSVVKIRADKIVATVSHETTDFIDIYTEDGHHWTIPTKPYEKAKNINYIWEEGN